jgi:hypothetical protein
MELRAVIHLFTLKGLKAQNIHTELEPVYAPEALALPMVKKWRRSFQQEKTDLSDHSSRGRHFTNDFGKSISSILAERPFSSCKILSRHLRIGKTTCLRILHKKLSLKQFHLCRMPHALLGNQKSERLSYAKFPLTALTEYKSTDFEQVITGDDES